MSSTETILLFVLTGIAVLIVGNIAFQLTSGRRNPPMGVFMSATECAFIISNEGMPPRT